LLVLNGVDVMSMLVANSWCWVIFSLCIVDGNGSFVDADQQWTRWLGSI
jgi:hypothetical protein